jgi:hypothetical protein
MDAHEITVGLPVWAHLFRKKAEIAATIIEVRATTDGSFLYLVELEVEDPFSGKMIRQTHKKPLSGDQLTPRLPSQTAVSQAIPTTKEQPKTDSKKAKEADLRAQIAELKQENALLEMYRPAMLEGAWRRLADADRTNRDLRYHIDEGERAFTRLAANLAEVEAYHPQISHLKDEAANFRDRYRRILYGELAEQGTQDEQEAEPTQPEPQLEQETLNPANLTTYARDTLTSQGPHDQARRAWLRSFAQERGYKDFWFTIYGQRSGNYQAGVPAGEEGWTHFLEKAVQYDVYCCFIAAYTPGQLEHLLKDAAARGEIKLDSMVLTPSNRRTPRS